MLNFSMEKTPIVETAEKAGQEVKLEGWVHTRRDHGKIVFIDLRDRSGILQVVFTPDNNQVYETAQKLRSEFVVSITGQINQRPEKMINDKISTGKVEMLATGLEILNESKTPPFEIDHPQDAGEDIRLKYRYLDLRRERMKNNLVMRHKIVKFIRDYFDGLGFLEVETPILTKGTPEGAREFMVPARLWPGKFYVLPQSPQQFKQLLMVAGIEKYFQIARCFRDEDQRGDRQAEFTQVDVEMSFITQENIWQIIESLMIQLVETLYPNKKITTKPFPRLTYKEAMEKYSSDKPDLRLDKQAENELAFCWIVDAPMFAESETAKKIVAVHHPFTMPNTEDMKAMPTEPLKWRAYGYDLALNGHEIWGGSIRIHDAKIQEQVFSILGVSEQEIANRFGHMLEAFSYGAPPHGGIAAGLDRIVAILQNEPNIREVIPFPKTGDNRDLMMSAPNIVSPKALKEANIQIAEEAIAEAKDKGESLVGFGTDLAD